MSVARYEEYRGLICEPQPTLREYQRRLELAEKCAHGTLKILFCTSCDIKPNLTAEEYNKLSPEQKELQRVRDYPYIRDDDGSLIESITSGWMRRELNKVLG